MNECPVCESAATDVQMAKAALKATREEMERLTAENAELRLRANVYFRELNSLRNLMARREAELCEGYIWREMA